MRATDRPTHTPMPRSRTTLPLLAAVTLLLPGCGDGRGQRQDGGRVSLVAAGDIASCWWRADEMTARLLDRLPGVVVTLGDNVYQSGSASQYRDCYGPTWGRHLSRTRPVPGNHEFRSHEATPYFAYFGRRAGEPGKGWYSFDVDGWHVVALNSEAPIKEGSEQLDWLRRDLAAHPVRCTLAYMHHPRFSSGKHGSRDRTADAWEVMYAAGVDVVLAGHDHHYERFAPQDPDGRADPARGIRQFVVGTGGAPTYGLRETAANSEVRNDRVYGVLALTFHPDSYAWRFVPVRGRRFTDTGTGRCH